MKLCKKCSTVKDRAEFNKNRLTHDGLSSTCTLCIRAYQASYRKKNRVRERIRHSMYKMGNPHVVQRLAIKRRNRLIQANVQGNDEIIIDLFYEIAARFQDLGRDVHVDHIIPLQGKAVSGLHCAANLQILSAAENLSKHNKFAA